MTNTMLVINTNKVMTDCTRQSLQDACRRWKCDYTEITESSEPYHHAALKLKAFDLVPHDRIFVVDSDTVIRGDAPNIFEITDPKKFYAVKNQQPHYPPAYNANVVIAEQEIERVLAVPETHFAGTFDAPWIAKNFFNSGVCVTSREYHKKIYDLAFYCFEGAALQWWDQIPLNIAVNVYGGYTDLGAEWNYQFPTDMGKMTAYIYHFAGDPTRYEKLKNIGWIPSLAGVNTREDLHTIVNRFNLTRGVELGTQRGFYAKYLLENTNLHLTMIDAWQHIEGYKDIANVSDAQHNTYYKETKANVLPFKGRYEILKQFSVPAAATFEDESLDFIYIDADHSYKATLADLNVWYPKLKFGGLLAGHDFLDGENICGSNFGVRSAVFDFLKNKTHTLYVTREQWPSWWFTKYE